VTRPRLVLCAKSPWSPPIRREHAFAREAALHGHRVDFVEQPADIRALRTLGTQWLRLAAGVLQPAAVDHLAVWGRSVPAPGHRGRLAEIADNALLARLLRGPVADPDAAVVANAPWQWPAVAKAQAGRRVFDCADNWAAMLPGRQRRIRELCRHIAAEADAVVVVNPSLAELFPGRDVTVVRNATAAHLCDGAPTPAPGTRRLVYVGTLSERFDAPLMRDVLDLLPDWQLALYGPCRYARHAGMPGEELRQLLDGHPGRAVWEGVARPPELAAALDSADVLVLPNRGWLSAGQDSMKLYDYCARGRPIVSTRFDQAGAATQAPHVAWTTTAGEFAGAVRAAGGEPPSWAGDRVRWAVRQTYRARWPQWAAAVFGAWP
jgi:glycosyltransferase involved in cell wall biosynthesis